jgi:hypothetical protein
VKERAQLTIKLGEELLDDAYIHYYIRKKSETLYLRQKVTKLNTRMNENHTNNKLFLTSID